MLLPARRFLSLAFSSCTAFAVCAQPQPPDSFQASRARWASPDSRRRCGHRYCDNRLAPFPRISVTAAPPEIPSGLVEQLAVGGIMVVPVGTSYQEIVIITKTAEGITRKRTIPVRFVPMVGGR